LAAVGITAGAAAAQESGQDVQSPLRRGSEPSLADPFALDRSPTQTRAKSSKAACDAQAKPDNGSCRAVA
jgi:hypothetical protein